MMNNHPLQMPFREAMSACAAGVHVVTTDGPAGRCGITMTAVCAVTDTPPTLLLCINRQSAFVPVLLENRALCVNVLADAQQQAAEYFAGMTALSMAERFDCYRWQCGQSGQLQLEGALAHLHGRVAVQNEVGTHWTFLVEISEIVLPSAGASADAALVYFRRRFAGLT